MNFSRWVDNSQRNFEDIIANINGYKDWVKPSIDPVSKLNLRFEIQEIFNEDVIITEEPSSKYNVYVYLFSFEQVVESHKNSANYFERIKEYESYIIIYTDGLRTYFCINRVGGFALTVLRKFNNLQEKNTIVTADYNTSKDFTDWLFYSANSLNLIDKENKLEINKIVGFKGNVPTSQSMVSKISGNGKEIMNALSTLAFMFETEQITYIKLKVSYLENHEVDFGLLLNGAIEIEDDNYTGSYMFGEEIEIIARILILISTHIFPKIKSKYIELKDSNLWGDDIKVKRLLEIGDIIQKQVYKKVSSVS